MVVRQVTREQLATLKATADALEHGNLDDPVGTHAPPAGPLRTIDLSLGCVLTPLLRCVAAGLPRDGGPGAVQRQQRRRHRRCCGEARARAAPQQAGLMRPEEEGCDT